MMKPSTKFVRICVIREATAAPSAPIIGIKIKLSTMLPSAPDKFIIHRYRCFSSANIHTFLIGPKYEKVVYHTSIFKISDDSLYELQYKMPTIKSENKVINKHWKSER